MAENDKPSAGSSVEVETAIAGRRSASIMMDEAGAAPSFRDHDGSGVVAEIGKDNLEVRTRGGASEEDDELDPEDLDEGSEGEEGGDTDPPKDDDEGSSPPEDLGDYDPQDPEAVQKFEQAYVSEETGGPNIAALQAEWDRNEQAGDGTLNEGTYKFLQDRYGLTKEQVKDIEAGQKAKRDAAAYQFNSSVDDAGGGRERVLKMVEWGKKGGYTQAQRARFTEAMNSGDPERAAEAVALLATRYEKATGDRAGLPRKGVRPGRDVTAGAARKPAGVEPFKTQADYSAAFKEARKSKDPAEIEKVRRRLRASPFYKPSRG